MNGKYYLTTTLPYVNAEPHIGFALEIVQADALARFHKLLGEEVIFNFGTDEHGQKIYQKALDENRDPQEYSDEYAAKFDALKHALNLSYNRFIRTTDQHHIKAAQEFWKLCDKNGDIYKKLYKTKYCVGCELEKTDSELVDGHCPLHPNRDLEIIEEENYFFRFSKYQKPLLDFYEKNPHFVVPQGKFKEIKTFVKEGLQDFSISRLKSKMPWGIPVPEDPDQVMYVWFDALINYISTLGWPENQENFKNFWPGHQVAGKDNLRQQTAIWQAMLASAGLPFSKQVFIHGFITVNGQKISKSLGNTINPIEVAQKYGTDALRYYLLAKINPTEDSDFTFEKFEEVYNGELANGLGNLVSRIAKLCEREGLGGFESYTTTSFDVIEPNLQNYQFDTAMFNLWSQIKTIDGLINKDEPWKITNKNELKEKLDIYVAKLLDLVHNLKPFLPETAEKIENQFKGPKIVSGSPLFPRLS
ncbi:MAG: Methionyl-tRNA synthetase [Candidatus Woesebacteria bacterium GW2011_GWD1_41_12]|uniref:Methionine--tRNA ligase n=5 Tax=Candidatus Woeseibacteriota TaxID=1752722 RepID=A0A0G0TD00_9BACT|nr:MAG: Methionyl-tRNA synthetase [Candidatus Woesebacteria bacterium GW2011_GWB1_40_12]KKR91066.1 MAG: Methionyl-tRNA synthetase [Candidatus Woesebacteria bacterium GW2011_GWD1_41_12]KKS17702.1 MAG: Methionyl-tRNA synthetase [Candidatus Woesebacteria bacterium GW2011_GWA1_41_7]OGM81744.1 MAG: methionine--tRNA ligase [Candidatus Woesebacteria bacterium RIFOXYB1_FULL_41_13]OGM87085.1 MAG: methionine--tRNA ligase [Candidatus Woesebacteria bacterium RIFOXYD1_FULL_41_28]